MQIFRYAIQKKMMSNSVRKMFSTMNAQIVMIGIEKLHSQPIAASGARACS